VLQSDAECCSASQCVAACCSVLLKLSSSHLPERVRSGSLSTHGSRSSNPPTWLPPVGKKMIACEWGGGVGGVSRVSRDFKASPLLLAVRGCVWMCVCAGG